MYIEWTFFRTPPTTHIHMWSPSHEGSVFREFLFITPAGRLRHLFLSAPIAPWTGFLPQKPQSVETICKPVSLCLFSLHEVPWRQRSRIFLGIPAPVDDDDDNDDDVPSMQTIFYHLMNKSVYYLGHTGDFPPLHFLSNIARTKIRAQRPARNVFWWPVLG